jgi:small ligand-binding sensory domain FIST
LIGCSAAGLIGNNREIEGRSGLSLMTMRLPDTELFTHYFEAQSLEEDQPPAIWHSRTNVRPEQISGWLLFGDPFNTPCDRLINQLNAAYPGKPIVGGLASTLFMDDPESFLFLNNKIFQTGLVGLAIGKGTRIDAVISQGCTPIGSPHTITKADQNIIFEIGSQPAYDVLVETVRNLDSDTQGRAKGNLFVGLVMNEYLEDYKRGDFLIRNILGANPEQGFLAVGALPKAGQTLQFQLRDATAAHEEMVSLLETMHRKLGRTRPTAALICSCNGRGIGLFQTPHHDAENVNKTFEPVEVAGFFCSGEIGPVGDKNFLHGYTSAIALFSKAD